MLNDIAYILTDKSVDKCIRESNCTLYDGIIYNSDNCSLNYYLNNYPYIHVIYEHFKNNLGQEHRFISFRTWYKGKPVQMQYMISDMIMFDISYLTSHISICTQSFLDRLKNIK